jgi:Ca-activated chloride channel family protein
VLTSFDPHTVRFGDPDQLWLLLAPVALLVLWIWRLVRHQRDVQQFRLRRRLPTRERLAPFGGLLFWLWVILAASATIVAAARPVATVSMLRTGGVDVIVLQDGSASMRTPDVTGDRWQRSIRFLRTLGESLRWKNDRIAMALFAHIAAPEVRLTSDPNTFFFFLDHLDRESPFRQEDDTTWDTNIELGINWGLKLVAKDEEIHGRSANARIFLLITDGQAWTGQVQNAIKLSRSRGIPIFVVGVGTTGGGVIPQVPKPGELVSGIPPPPIRSALDRASLRLISSEGDGQYLELDRETDREVANRIVDAARRRARAKTADGTQELYWPCLFAAAVFLGVAALALREQAELWIQMAGASVALAVIWVLAR